MQGSIVLATGDTVRCEMSHSPTVEEDLDDHTGTVRELNEVEAMALMKGKAGKVRVYMKTNNIKLKRDVGDYIRVFDYYLSLWRLWLGRTLNQDYWT